MALLEGFDERSYLAHNPDVGEAVARGECMSGLEHFLLFGAAEGRAGAPPGLAGAMVALHERLATLREPPAELRTRAHGREDAAGYSENGRIVSANLEASLHRFAIELTPGCRVLDFGCGAGRVMHWFQPLHDDCRFTGTDVDEQAVAWCREHVAHAGEFGCNRVWPPLPHDDGCFDVVLSVAVLAHLPEDMHLAWLAELARITRRGGTLMLTTHGEHLLPEGFPHARGEFERRGFCHIRELRSPGLPDFCCTSIHSEAYIRAQWSRFFEIEAFVTRCIVNHLDLIICRRR